MRTANRVLPLVKEARTEKPMRALWAEIAHPM
jgi:hypothetical protein